MKTKRIFFGLGALLFALTSCVGDPGPTPSSTSSYNPGIYAIYELYLESLGEGETPLSYEEWVYSVRGEQGDPGQNGETPYIGENGNWWLGDDDTGIPSAGRPGETGDKGPTGEAGENGKTPYIHPDTLTWWIGDEDTGIFATGYPGEDHVILIGENGNWWIDGIDTGLSASPEGHGEFTVTFNPNTTSNGEEYISETRQVSYGEALGELPVPVMTDREFLGWFTGFGPNDMEVTSSTQICSDMDLIAKWDRYIVMFNNENGVTIEHKYIPHGEPAYYDGEAPYRNPSEDGTRYVFDGWDHPYDFVTSDLSLYPCFLETDGQSVEIRLDAGMGNFGLGVKAKIENAHVGERFSYEVELPTPEAPEGLFFVGYTREDGTLVQDGNLLVRGNETLVASYGTSQSYSAGERYFVFTRLEDGYLATLGGNPDYEVRVPSIYREQKVVAFAIDLGSYEIGHLFLPDTIREVDFDGTGSLSIEGLTTPLASNGVAKNLEDLKTLVFSDKVEKIEYGFCGNDEQYMGGFSDLDVYIPASVTSFEDYWYYLEKVHFYFESPTLPAGFNMEYADEQGGARLHLGYTGIRVRPEDGSLSYIIIETEEGYEAEVAGYYLEGDVRDIPSEIDGYPVTSIGDRAFAEPYVMNNGPSEVVLPEGIVRIGSEAFQNSSIERMTIPSSVAVMGYGAFQGAANLSVLTFGEGNLTTIPDLAFQGCLDLKEVSFPKGLVSIGESAFAETGLISVSFPEGFASLDNYVFRNCSNLASVTLPSTLVSMQDAVFSGAAISSILIPEGVSIIGKDCFASCPNLEVIYFEAAGFDDEEGFNPDGIEEVYSYREEGTTTDEQGFTYRLYQIAGVSCAEVIGYVGGAVGEATIPSSIEGHEVTALGPGLFYQDQYPARLDLPSTISEIDDETFYDIYNMMYVVFRDQTVMEDFAHLQIENHLEFIYLEEGQYLGDGGLIYVLEVTEGETSASIVDYLYKEAYGGYMYVQVETLGGHPLRGIAPGAFQGEAWITDLNIWTENRPIQIGDGAFEGCANLSSIDLSGVSSIGSRAFASTALRSFQIPLCVTDIASGAFTDCPRIYRIQTPYESQPDGWADDILGIPNSEAPIEYGYGV